MDEFIKTTADTIGNAIGGFFGLDAHTVKIVVIVFVVLHLLTHEIPMLVLLVWGFYKAFRYRNEKKEYE